MLKRIGLKEKQLYQILGAFIFLSMLLVSLIGDKGYLQLSQLKSEERKLLQEIQQLEEEKVVWQEKVISMKKDLRYIENIAREKLGLVRSDEIIIEVRKP